MKLDKKWWLIIGFIVVAIVGIVLVIVFAFNKDEEPEPVVPNVPKYTISIEVINESLGDILSTNATNIYNEGESGSYTFTPRTSNCIESILVDGENVFDYIEDETIDVQKPFNYSFDNITSDHSIVVKFDEAVSLSALEYEAVEVISRNNETSESNIEKYGCLKIAGASSVVPKTGRVKLEVVPTNEYKLSKFVLPGEDLVYAHNVEDDYTETKNNETFSYTYDNGKSTIVLTSPFTFMEKTMGSCFKLVFIPVSIDVLVYSSIDGGNTFSSETSEPIQKDLFSYYFIGAEDYTWYYSISSEVSSVSIKLATVKIYDDGEGNLAKYINLDPEIYADNQHSKTIVLVAIKNN